MHFGVPHLPQHDPFNRSEVERNMQTSPGHKGKGHGNILHSLNTLEIAIIGAALVVGALLALYWVIL